MIKRIDQILATWLLPASAVQEDWVVDLDNQTLVPVKVTEATVLIRGEKTGQAINPDVISLTIPDSLSPAKVQSIRMRVHRNLLSPDHYQGTLRFKVKGSDDTVTINTDLNLRDGPFWAAVIILLGIVVGRLARGMSTPEAQKQIKFLPRLYQLQASAEKVQNVGAQTYLAGQIQNAKERIGSAKETEEVLSQMLDKLKARIDFLVALEGLEDKLTKLDPDLKKKLGSKIEDARRELIGGNAEKAEDLRKEVVELLETAQQSPRGRVTPDDIKSVREWFVETSGQWFKIEVAEVPAEPGGRWLGWLAKLMA